MKSVASTGSLGNSRVKTITITAVMAALLAVTAPLAIPLSGMVPISLATFSVMLIGVVMGPAAGIYPVAIYILLGILGLPVFSSYRAGLQVILGPTGGFILGYLPLVLLTGLFARNVAPHTAGRYQPLVMAAGMILGTAACYVCGTIWFCILTKATLSKALAACVIPFIPGDLIKIAIVCILGPKIVKILG